MNKYLRLFKKKETFFIIILVGLILLVISVPTKEEEKSEKENALSNQQITLGSDYCKELETRLEEILSCIHGVGNVKVMITLKDSGESVVEKDSSSEQSSSNGEESSSWQEETIYTNDSENTYPYVVNTYKPQIQGVLVVAQGADDPMIQKQIMDGVMALFGVESHKISIINME